MTAPGLDTILNALAAKGRLGHLTLSPRPSGDGYQGAHKPPGHPGYQCETTDDPVDALIGALAPPHGTSWEAHLGAAPISKGKSEELKKIGERMRGEAAVLEPTEDFSDLI